MVCLAGTIRLTLLRSIRCRITGIIHACRDGYTLSGPMLGDGCSKPRGVGCTPQQVERFVHGVEIFKRQQHRVFASSTDDYRRLMISAHVIHSLFQAHLGLTNRDYVHALLLHIRHLIPLSPLRAAIAPSDDTLDAPGPL